MISEKFASAYCSEDMSKIENYEQAVNDPTCMWHCHHRLETDNHVSASYLKKRNLYYNRPANELIFLTLQQHSLLHKCAKRGVYSKSYRLKLRHSKNS